MSSSLEGARRLGGLEFVLLLVAVAVARLIAQTACHVYDDAFISYRYAQNLAAGAGMVFNPGAAWEPVLGTTTPGYTALIAFFVSLGFGALPASLALNVVFDVVSAGLCIVLLGRDRTRSCLTLLAFAAMPEVARISAGGMEAPLLLSLALAATWASRRGHLLWAGSLAALACTVRPEALLLVLVLALPLRRNVGGLLRFGAPVALVGVAYTALLISVYGSPIPHSVTSKAQVHGGSPLFATWAEILTQAFLPRRVYLPLLPFVALGLVRSLGRRATDLAPVLRFASAIVLAYLAARPHTWGWYYYLPLFAYCAFLAEGLVPLVEGAAARLPGPLAWTRRLAVPGATAVVLGLVVLGARLMPDRVTSRVYRPMGEWASEVGFSDGGRTLLASDIGAIGYFGRGTVLDSEGLTFPAALDTEAFPDEVALIAGWRPDYLLLTASRGQVAQMRASDEITRAYYPVRRFSVTGETELEPELATLPDHWVQDYLLFRRRY